MRRAATFLQQISVLGLFLCAVGLMLSALFAGSLAPFLALLVIVLAVAARAIR